MNYATGHALNVNDIFMSFPTEKLELTTETCQRLVGNRHKELIAKKIFKRALSMIIEDIIDNNVTFVLPTKSKKAELKIKRFGKDVLSLARKRGKWLDVDFLTSNFTAYLMVFNFLSLGVMREKLIYLDPKHRDLITQYTNEGKQYY